MQNLLSSLFNFYPSSFVCTSRHFEPLCYCEYVYIHCTLMHSEFIFFIQFTHAFLDREWDSKIKVLNMFLYIFILSTVAFIFS
jgi:hypothetical protein